MANYIKKMAGGCCSSTETITLNLSDLADVETSNLTDGLILQYNAVSQKWEAVNNSGNGGQEITEITAENKDAAIAAATNLVFKPGMLTVPEEDHYVGVGTSYNIAVYANINGSNVPLPIDYLYDFLEHLPYICVMDVYKTSVEGELPPDIPDGAELPDEMNFINAPNVPFTIIGGGINMQCSYNGYWTSPIDLSSRKYIGEEAEYNNAIFYINVNSEDGQYIQSRYIKDDDAIEYGLNNILKQYSITPGPGCLTIQLG